MANREASKRAVSTMAVSKDPAAWPDRCARWKRRHRSKEKSRRNSKRCHHEASRRAHRWSPCTRRRFCSDDLLRNHGRPPHPNSLPKREGSANLLSSRKRRTRAKPRESPEASRKVSSLLRLLGVGLIDQAAANDGGHHFGRSNLMRIDVKNVLRNDNQVGELTHFQ